MKCFIRTFSFSCFMVLVGFLFSGFIVNNAYADTLVKTFDLSSCFQLISNNAYEYFSFDWENFENPLNELCYNIYATSFDYFKIDISNYSSSDSDYFNFSFGLGLDHGGRFTSFYLNSDSYFPGFVYYPNEPLISDFSIFDDTPFIRNYNFNLSAFQPIYFYDSPSLILSFYTFDSGIIPSGSLSIVQNGTYDVTDYSEAVVNVPAEVIQGDYHDDLVSINNSILICAAVCLVIYFFYCIYRMIIKNTGVK